MEKAATIPVRIVDPDPQRTALLATQVRAVFPAARLVSPGMTDPGGIVLIRLEPGMAVPEVEDGTLRILLSAPGMDLPAGPYVVLQRPFSLTGLQEALQRASRSLLAGPVRIVLAPDLSFWPQEQKLVRQDHAIMLTDAETALLLRLWQAGGDEVSRACLLREVLHYSPEADSHALETLVWRLRSKLGEDSGQSGHLCTGEQGYFLRVFS